MQNESGRPQRKIFYGWWVVALSLVIMTAAYGIYYAWPVFYVPILNEFGWSRAETALIFSTTAIVYMLASPVSGILFDKLGPRKIFPVSAAVIAIGALGCSQASEIWQFCIFMGVLVAIGTGFAGFVPNLALVSAWFEKKRATAVGISQMGTRDSFLLTPLIQMAILALGWRHSFQVLAAATAIVIMPLSLFLRAKPQDMGLMPDGGTVVKTKGETKPGNEDNHIVNRERASTGPTLLSALRNYRFWAIFTLMFGAGFTFTALLNHFVALITDIGFTAMFAANLFLIYAITSMTGRACGFIADIIGREIAFMLSMVLMLLPLPVLLITKDTSAPWTLYVFITCFGFGSGMYTPAYTAIAADLFQGKHFGAIIGTANMGYGISASFGTWLYGYIFDMTGAYTIAIVIAMFSVGIMCIAIWVASPRKGKR